MGRLTTHVLDAAQGKPGNNIEIQLYRVEENQLQLLGSTLTNHDGRCDAPLLEADAFIPGTYQLHFAVGAYYREQGMVLPDPSFLDVVVLRFGVSAADQHYHVPLLVSPYSYSTYRGS